MTLPSSPNSISLNQVQTEFGGTNPISITEYYSAEGTLPTSGMISLSQFHGLSKPVNLTSGVNVQQIVASDYISDGGTLTIPSGVYVWSDNTSTAALIVDVDNATIINNGYIIGKGGAGANAGGGAGEAGGPAIKVTGSAAFIQNNSGAYIAGGGGGGGSRSYSGGGGGAGGGKGGNSNTRHATMQGGAGGAVGQSGANGQSWGSPYTDDNYCGSDGGTGDPIGYGGGAGGGGAAGIDTGSSCGMYGGAGGGGGRILPGTGGVGGDRGGPYRSSGTEGGEGGAAGNAGQNGTATYGQEDGTGGGGGWGAAGGSGTGAGGAGGKSIEVTGSSVLLDNGTVYGTSDATDAVELTSAAQINSQNNRQEILVSDYITSGETLIIPESFWVWSDDTATAALTIDIPCTIHNNGYIIGKGGDGGRGDGGDNVPAVNPTAGGPAIKINSSVSNVTIKNFGTGFIAGGGGGGGGGDDGGGGGGAGGGRGGEGETPSSNPYVAGGVLNSAGDDATGSGGIGIGGGAGGSGGSGSGTAARSGGGGGRILPGDGGVNTVVSNGTAGSGGSADNPGGAGTGEAGGGGGGWGAAGGNGGGSISVGGDGSDGAAGGKAIEDSGNTYTLTNNGTIYGATT